jgi:hypothetical protein
VRHFLEELEKVFCQELDPGAPEEAGHTASPREALATR